MATTSRLAPRGTTAEEEEEAAPAPDPNLDAPLSAIDRLVWSTRQAFEGLGAVGPVWTPLLEGLLRDALDRWSRARAEIAETGLTTETGLGAVKPHPAAVQAAKAHDQLLGLLVQLGLTPLAYQRLRVERTDDDELDSFLRDTPA